MFNPGDLVTYSYEIGGSRYTRYGVFVRYDAGCVWAVWANTEAEAKALYARDHRPTYASGDRVQRVAPKRNLPSWF